MEEDVNNIKYYDNAGNEIDPNTGKVKTGGSSESSGAGWLGGVIGAIPGILSALFPNGIKGNSNSNYPTVTTLPNGNTSVNLAGGNNILIIALIAMVGFLLFTGRSPIQPEKKK